MPRITKKTVDATEPDPSRKVLVWDDRLPGFGLTVHPTGSKVYFFNYRTHEGRQRRIKIDKHGAITADEARKEAERMAADVRAGRDPLGERKAKRDTPTVTDVLTAYTESEKFRTKGEHTRITDLGRVNGHLIPTMGRLYANALTPEDVMKAFRAIRDGKTAKATKTGPRGLSRVRGGEGAARKSLKLLGTALAWAKGERWQVVNPVRDVSLGTDNQRDTILQSADEYRRLFEALDRLEQDRRIRSTAAAAIRLIALTGARKGEIINLRWRHVNLKAGEIRLPRTEHKTGTKTQKERVIGLPAVASAIIAMQAPEDPDPDAYVFPPSRGAGPMVMTKPWALVRAEAGLPSDLGLHGLRHSLASWMAMQGAEAAGIMHALGHTRLETTARYLHMAKSAHQALAEDAAVMISDAFRAAKGEPSATVTDISTGAPVKRDIK